MTGVTQYNLPKAGGSRDWGFWGGFGGGFGGGFIAGNLEICIKNDVTGKLSLSGRSA